MHKYSYNIKGSFYSDLKIFFLCLQEQVQQHANHMVSGLLGLLEFCPQEVAHLRKELLIAARHILATDLRNSKDNTYFVYNQASTLNLTAFDLFGGGEG